MNKAIFKTLLGMFAIGVVSVSQIQANNNYLNDLAKRPAYIGELAQSLEQCAQRDADAIANGTAKSGGSALEKLQISDVVGLENKWAFEYIKSVYINRYNMIAEGSIVTTSNLKLPNMEAFLYRDSLVREFNAYVGIMGQ